MRQGLQIGKPSLLLAPMEGVTDYPMRALMSGRGGFTLCVSEFIRVSDVVLPKHVLIRDVPELNHGSVTETGTPVQVQLLGGDAGKLAETARLAVELGAWGIDLNFGCPAPTVNRHDGGATLLKYPRRIFEIVRKVRQEVPAHIPVSAKLRLGWDCIEDIHENADRAAEAGANWITIHGRTRAQGYAPPALWTPIGQVCRRLAIPVVANGDINTMEDFQRCREETGSDHFMIGRGALADPILALKIARELGIDEAKSPLDSVDWLQLMGEFETQLSKYQTDRKYHLRRMKQWLNMASRTGQLSWFSEVKRSETVEALFEQMKRISLVQ